MENQVYMLERKERKIYHDPDLQMSFILLIFSLMLRPKYEFFLFYYFPSKVNHCLFVARPWSLSIAINFLLTTRSSTSPSTLTFVRLFLFLIICFFMMFSFISFLFLSDINHPANVHIIPLLCERTLEMGASEYRLLKLLSRKLFDVSNYRMMDRVGSGAFGVVCKATLETEKMDVR